MTQTTTESTAAATTSTLVNHFPYKVIHQRIVLDVDLYEHALVGFTDLYIQPLEDDVREIRLHCSQCHVSSVCQLDIRPNTISVGEIHVTQKLIRTDLVDEEIISNSEDSSILNGTSKKQRSLKHLVEHQKLERYMDDEGLLLLHFSANLPKDIVTVFRVYYELVEPKAGVYFAYAQREKDEEPMPYLYTHNQLIGARLWFPCCERLHSLSTFEFQITTAPDAIVVCTGDLIQQVLNESSTLKTSYFTQLKWPISPNSVSLAVGPFKILPDPHLSFATYFYLPHHNVHHVKHTIQFMRSIFEFFENYLGMKYTDLFNSYKQVFVDNAYSNILPYASMSIIDCSLLLDPKVIDNTMDNVTEIANAVATQYFGHFFYAKKPEDLWLIIGLAGYLSLQYLQEEFGANELKYKVYKVAKYLLRIDTHVQPLYCTNYIHPAELLTPLLVCKSPYVIYMLDKLCRCSMRGLLNIILHESMNSGKQDFDKRLLSTKDFLKRVKRTYLVDTKNFADYWIYSTGIPRFNCLFTYDADRNVVELRVKQALPFQEAKRYVGPLTVNIYEIENASSYEIDIGKESEYFEFSCRSKTRKKQRKKMREEGALDNEEDLEQARIKIPLSWIRIDAGLNLLRILKFQQKGDMWMNQLENDKDIIAQFEAIMALHSDTTKTVEVLAKYDAVLADAHIFYRVRIQTAYEMSKFSDQNVRNTALAQLMKFFKSRFYDEKMLYVKPNDFSNFAEYFLKKEIPLALSTFIEESTKMTPSSVVEFLIELIKYNDDSKNRYSSCFYLSSLIKALGQVNSDKTDSIVTLVKRLLVMDSLLPSYHQCISVECLHTLGNIMAKGKLPFDRTFFLQYLESGNNYFVRIAAWQSLMNILQSHSLVVTVSEENHDTESILLKVTEEIFHRFLSLIESDKEFAKLKYEVTEIIMEGIHKCSARLAVLHRENASIDAMKQAEPLSKYLTLIRSPAKENRLLVDRMWNLLRGKHTEFDLRLRHSLLYLYNVIWTDLPNCYRPDSKIIPEDYVETVNVLQVLDDEMIVENDVLSDKTSHGETQEPITTLSPTEKEEKEKKRKHKEREKEEAEVGTRKKAKPSVPTPEMPFPQTTEAPKPNIGQVRVKITLPVKSEAVEPTDNQSVMNRQPLPKRSLEEENFLMELQRKEQEKLRKELEESNGTERLILIHFEGSRMNMYVNLYISKTSDALYRSCPIVSGTVHGNKGIIWFPLPGMEKVDLEEINRSVVENGELAYWVAGNSICIAYGKTQWTEENELRLLEPCSIFGRYMYPVKNLNKAVGTQNVYVKRMKRLIIRIETSSGEEELQIDLFEKHFDLLLVKLIEQLPISSCIEVFGKLLYFQVPQFIFEAKDLNLSNQDKFFRDYLYPGEIAYWASGKSILLGTGDTGVTQKQVKQKQTIYKLLDKCLVFGKFVSMNLSQRTSNVRFVDAVHMYERKVRIVLMDQRTKDEKFSMIALLNETTTADRIYSNLPFTEPIKLFGECIYFDSGNTVENNTPMLPELNSMKVVVQPGELAYWCDSANICIAYGRTPSSQGDEARLSCACNIWATVCSHSSDEVKKLMRRTQINEGDLVNISKYLDLPERNVEFVKEHGLNLLRAQSSAQQVPQQ
jgi:transcription initiation factor TFIID subunit 2